MLTNGAVTAVLTVGYLSLRRVKWRRPVHATVARYPDVIVWNSTLADTISDFSVIASDAQLVTILDLVDRLRILDSTASVTSMWHMSRLNTDIETCLRNILKTRTNDPNTIRDALYLHDEGFNNVQSQLRDILHNKMLSPTFS